MGLKSLIERLKHVGADTPDTSEKNTGYQRKAPIHAGCTPDTPDTSRLVNDSEVSQDLPLSETVNQQAHEPPSDPRDWHELAAAYYLHHSNCPACISAGRGEGYGLRCGAGAALWNRYQVSK
jgi:hypothetical protein